MKKIISILLLLLTITLNIYSQVDWSNYSTSFIVDENKPALGVAIPYNGIYDNFEKNVVGISHWNPSYKLHIDTLLDSKIPVYFVYDTSGVYFLAPFINKENAKDFEMTVLMNNKTSLIPWSPFNTFTTKEIGGMKRGSGMSECVNGKMGEYLVAHLRNKNKEVVSSIVIYFRKLLPSIKLLITSDSASSFSNIVKNQSTFVDGLPDIGWHRQYSNVKLERGDTLQLSTNETNILIELDAMVYKKEAVEYALQKDGRLVRDWHSNDYDSKYIMLKDLSPGIYTLRIRYIRQRGSTINLNFIIPRVWYKTAAFKAAIVVFSIIFATLFYVLIRYFKQKKALLKANNEAEQASGKLQDIHSLLNPHFTFNALGSIQGLINKGNIEYANKYLSAFGELMHETLNDSKFAQIPLEKELGNLEKYIELERLRSNFRYQKSVASSIDILTVTIPPFILQPFVENAIKHGLRTKIGDSILTLDISRDHDAMVIKIEDNGNGFPQSVSKEGHGIILSKKRIGLLNKTYGEDLIQLDIESSHAGSLICLIFKKWL